MESGEFTIRSPVCGAEVTEYVKKLLAWMRVTHPSPMTFLNVECHGAVLVDAILKQRSLSVPQKPDPTVKQIILAWFHLNFRLGSGRALAINVNKRATLDLGGGPPCINREGAWSSPSQSKFILSTWRKCWTMSIGESFWGAPGVWSTRTLDTGC